MSAAKHTPGPWKVGHHSSKGNVPIYGADNEHVAWLDGSAGTPYAPTERGAANARLIAAAPELLEIARRFAAWSCCRTDGHCSMLPDVVPCDPCAVRAALRQAVG